MEEQFVGIRDILDIKQFDLGIGLRIEVIVHILQHVLDTDLFAIADAPHAIELQAFDDSTLQDKDCRCSRATDEIHSHRIEVWDRECEHTMMVAVQQSDTVRTDQGCPIFLASVENTLF